MSCEIDFLCDKIVEEIRKERIKETDLLNTMTRYEKVKYLDKQLKNINAQSKIDGIKVVTFQKGESVDDHT